MIDVSLSLVFLTGELMGTIRLQNLDEGGRLGGQLLGTDMQLGRGLGTPIHMGRSPTN